MPDSSSSGAAAEIGLGEGMFLLPPPSDKCQICAVDHSPKLPHNAQSLFYQVRFNMEHGRAPTWQDAMAHCDEAMRAAWTQGLKDLGVDIQADAGLIGGGAHG